MGTEKTAVCRHCGIPIARMERHPDKWQDAKGFTGIDYHFHAPAEEVHQLRAAREALEAYKPDHDPFAIQLIARLRDIVAPPVAERNGHD